MSGQTHTATNYIAQAASHADDVTRHVRRLREVFGRVEDFEGSIIIDVPYTEADFRLAQTFSSEGFQRHLQGLFGRRRDDKAGGEVPGPAVLHAPSGGAGRA